MEKIVSLCKRRGFIFPGSEIYGGLANSFDYGPLGFALKNNIKKLWLDRYVNGRSDVFGLDAALIMNPKVWEASGHLKEFVDPLVECKKCHERYRGDQFPNAIVIAGKSVCPNCGGNEFTQPKQFNLMLKTFLGPAEEQANIVYFRPETAQGMFVNFKNILDTMRPDLPFGIAQVGKAFRNEITPGNFIFRTREFEQMEIEFFVRPEEASGKFEYWKDEMMEWMKLVGIDMKKVHEFEQPEGERAHYSARTIDFEYDFPFGRKELYGLANRTDFDLKNHSEKSGIDLRYREEGSEPFYPYVIEPTWGVDRTVLALLDSAYDDSDPKHVVLKLKPALAPYKAAVFPLLANKPQLVQKAQEIFKSLVMSHKSLVPVVYDGRGNIGKRYYAQDEIGTPACITVDFQTLEDDAVTIRDRDTAKQERVGVGELVEILTRNDGR